MVKAAGPQHHRETIERIRAFGGPFVLATFVIEHGGQYDGAVRILVDDEVVGSIPQSHAEKWRKAVAAVDQATGWVELDVGEFVDVWVRSLPTPCEPGTPFLPPFTEWTVPLDDASTAFFDAKLNSRAKTKRMVVHGEIHDRRETGAGWWLQVDDTVSPLGVIDDAGLRQAQSAGFPLTCHVVIRRRLERPLRVEVLLP
jgi:hypothetical protein